MKRYTLDKYLKRTVLDEMDFFTKQKVPPKRRLQRGASRIKNNAKI
jgi:hypothetical protein